MKNKMYLLMVVFVGALLGGCAGNTPIERGIVSSPEVTITAEDKSFVLKPGQRFKTPFTSKRAIADMLDPRAPMVDGWKQILAKKQGKRVRVSVAGEENDFFGILVFGSVKDIKQCTGPALRSHSIAIPKMYVDAAKGGSVSVVYESFQCRGNKENFNWMLWMSDLNF
ncbi:MAG: hypothetical protein OEY66_10485 [Gammaproteobacteria bacterium]|nr:hypothetical protein [Gammaproteobacteria bacterium]